MEENAYQILGLPHGPEATDADIKKAYRKLALTKHPDKNRDNPNAAAEFAELQKAYAILTDADARKALDDLLKAKVQRAERQVVQSEKRRRMMDELERREKQVEKERSQEEVARAKLKMEIDRLRKQAVEREAKLFAEQRAAAAAAAPPGSAAAAGPASCALKDTPAQDRNMSEKLGRTLKVSWHKKAGDYNVSQLRAAFAGHGVVEDVVLREGKKKGSALVVMATQEAAAAAAGAVCGDMDNPLLVIPFPKVVHAADQHAENFPAREGAGGEPLVHSQHPPSKPGSRQPAAPAVSGMRPAGSAPLFAAAGAGGAGPLRSGLPAKPSAPLFAAGAPAVPAERDGQGVGQPSPSPLFPGAAALTPGAARDPLARAGVDLADRGTQGDQKGTAGLHSGRPLFAAAAAAQGPCSDGESNAGIPAGFGSYRPPSSQGVHVLNRDVEQGTLQRLRQAAERQRIILELAKENGQ